MYTGHFGLDDGPFHGKAEGQEVYVGPQQATVIVRLRKALGTGGTTVAVSGPVGVGKTTLVRHAISGLAGGKIVISVDRMRLEPDEVLDLLLTRFEVSRQPKGTIQRVAAFRRLLQERLSDDTRVFIIVEDAARVGEDALLELEALTATDSGEPVGANIVLIGGEELSSLIGRPALARLRQRVRLRQVVAPFDADEVEGYMRHCLEAAGGVLEQIFEPGTARIVHRYSGGIARVVDNLCEAALIAAAEAGLVTVLPEFLREVAENCGMEPQLSDDDERAGESPPVAAPSGRDEVAGASGEKSPAGDQPGPPFAPGPPPRLALVESPAAASTGVSARAPEAREEWAPEFETGQDPDESLPVVDALAGSDPEAGAAPASLEEESIRPGLPVSRIDQVLPELIRHVHSSARAGGQPTSVFSSPPPSPGIAHDVDDEQDVDDGKADDDDIPMLSSSMRVSMLPVRRIAERPVGENELPVDRAQPDRSDVRPPPPAARDATREPAADTGIAEALSETAGEKDAGGEAASFEPVTAGIAMDAMDDRPAEQASAAKEGAKELAKGAAAEDIGEVAPRQVEAAEPAEAAAPEPVDGMALPDASAEGPASDEIAPQSVADDESFSFGELVAEEADDEPTTEAPTLSAEEEPTLAPDAATDVFVTENDGGDAAEEPELDALQAAIQAANAWQASDAAESGEADSPAPAARAPAEVPEITLDLELEKEKPSSTELDRWAEELSKAKSLEDISDMLAETIFGNEEIEAISAEIRAKKATERAAAESQVTAPPKAAEPQPVPAQKTMPARTSPPRPVAAPQKAAPARPGRPAAAGGGINMTMSQRIEMVNSLKGRKPGRPLKPIPGMRVAEIVLAEQPDEPLPKVANAPAPIEAQIDTAITQSRKILSEADLARMAEGDGGDDDGAGKGSRGLFGFFRRSSKS